MAAREKRKAGKQHGEPQTGTTSAPPLPYGHHSITTEIPPARLPGMFIKPPAAWAGSWFGEPNTNLN